MPIQSINPATGNVIKSFDELSDEQVESKLTASQNAYNTWKYTSLEERAEYMRNAASAVRDSSEDYARLLTQEMGKVITEARAEVEKCAFNFDHFADSAHDYLSPRTVVTDASESYVSYEPLGPILIIMPWNFAFWQVLRMAAPILLAGNTIVLKHASNVPESALAIENIFRKAGFPEGVFQTLLIGSSKIEKIIEHPIIRGVSLTGSEPAGRAVGAQAGKNIKPVVLELGGSDPSIVLADADLDMTVKAASYSRLLNNGQSCIGSKRYIVVEAIYDQFMEKLLAEFKTYVPGDPMLDETKIGPVVSQDSLDEVLGQVQRAVDAGATIELGGKQLDRPGSFLAPTILSNITSDVPTYYEEIFGPVASVIKVKDENEAIEVANATDFGLGSSIYTADVEHGKTLVPRIEAGCVFINGMVKSDPRLPFGGIKNSGIGRELSAEGARAFTNVKSVWIK